MSHYCLQDYHQVANYCPAAFTRGGGVGVGLYVKENVIKFATCNDVKAYCQDSIMEAAATKLVISACSFIVVCLYRAPEKTQNIIDKFVWKLCWSF